MHRHGRELYRGAVPGPRGDRRVKGSCWYVRGAMSAPVHDDVPPDPVGDAACGDAASGTNVPVAGDLRRRPRLQVTLIVLGALAVLAVGLVAASRGRAGQPWAGEILPRAQNKPEFVLTGTDGRPFDLHERTEGRWTVLFFGYTSCPDICPINLGTLNTALETLGPSVRDQFDVVFVSVDPGRDSPTVIRDFLDGFDSRFIGLTGTEDQIVAAQEAAKVPPAEEGTAAETGSNGTVGHATQMIVYGPDGLARIVYPFGTRQSDWTRDLPRLLGGDVPTPRSR